MQNLRLFLLDTPIFIETRVYRDLALKGFASKFFPLKNVLIIDT